MTPLLVDLLILGCLSMGCLDKSPVWFLTSQSHAALEKLMQRYSDLGGSNNLIGFVKGSFVSHITLAKNLSVLNSTKWDIHLSVI